MREVWLEIGFGSGEHLLSQAEHHPEIGFIGAEPFINGVASLLGAIETRKLTTIRIHDGDAREVLSWLPDGSIGAAFILFPDPWPKKRQQKRRLVSQETVAELARILRPGGLLRFASDDADYAAEALFLVSRSGAFDWQAERAERLAHACLPIGRRRATSGRPWRRGESPSISALPSSDMEQRHETKTPYFLALAICLAPLSAAAGTDIEAACYKDCESATTSNIEYKACLARAADKADAALNEAYKDLLGAVGQPARRWARRRTRKSATSRTHRSNGSPIAMPIAPSRTASPSVAPRPAAIILPACAR